MFKNFKIDRKILIVLSYIAIVAVSINGYFYDLVARGALAAEPGIVLTVEERAWLDSHPVMISFNLISLLNTVTGYNLEPK